MGAFPGQPGETAIHGSVTCAARVDCDDDEIRDAIAVPEPSGNPGILVGAALLRVLHRRRNRPGSAAS